MGVCKLLNILKKDLFKSVLLGDKIMDIEKEIKQIVSIQLDKKIEKIFKKSDYVKDLEADSLDMIELVMNLEEKFKIDIPDEDMKYINTIENTIKYIKNKIIINNN